MIPPVIKKSELFPYIPRFQDLIVQHPFKAGTAFLFAIP